MDYLVYIAAAAALARASKRHSRLKKKKITVLVKSLGHSPQSSTKCQQTFRCCKDCLVWLALWGREISLCPECSLHDMVVWGFMANTIYNQNYMWSGTFVGHIFTLLLLQIADNGLQSLLISPKLFTEAYNIGQWNVPLMPIFRVFYLTPYECWSLTLAQSDWVSQWYCDWVTITISGSVSEKLRSWVE